MKRLLVVLAIALAIMLIFMTPTLAQTDATPEPAPESTAAAPDTQITVQDGATLNISPDAPADSASTPVSTNSLAVIVGAIVAFVAGVGMAILVGGKPADAALTMQLETLRQNNEAVNAMRAVLQSRDATTMHLATTLRDVVKTIAPITPATSDDLLGAVLEDLTKPPDPHSLSTPHTD